MFFREKQMESANSAKRKKKGLLDWPALGEGRRVYDGPVTKNRAPNINRKGSKTALSLPKSCCQRVGLE
jgi:hypothetical protein